MRDGGKGDKPRPLSVPMEQFDNNWDSIFKKKECEHNWVLTGNTLLSYPPQQEYICTICGYRKGEF